MGNPDTLELVVEDRSSNIPPKAKGSRFAKMTPEERKQAAKAAATARWEKARSRAEDGTDTDDFIVESIGPMPEAKHKGTLRLMNLEIPCYVLSDGRRVIGRTSATEMLTGIKGGGAFEKYIGVTALRPYISVDAVSERMVAFRLPEVEGLERRVMGLPADALIDVCQGFVSALEAHSRQDATVTLTPRQLEMALHAGMFVAACAKVGLDAMIDEATGYQYERAQDALQVKLHAYLETEMRRWEKTFPDELWIEFGRLTGWSHSVTHRPKYWGHLVNELVYEYLDPDVAKWLKLNAPEPRGGRNYHQWLTAQYGLKKLVEHIWKLIGVANTCQSMTELKDRMAEIHGKQPVQFRLYLPNPTAANPAVANGSQPLSSQSPDVAQETA